MDLVNTKDTLPKLGEDEPKMGEISIWQPTADVMYVLKAIFISLIVLMNSYFLILSMKTHMKRDPYKNYFSEFMVMHYLNMVVLLMGFIFQLIVLIIPLLYFMIIFSSMC